MLVLDFKIYHAYRVSQVQFVPRDLSDLEVVGQNPPHALLVNPLRVTCFACFHLGAPLRCDRLSTRDEFDLGPQPCRKQVCLLMANLPISPRSPALRPVVVKCGLRRDEQIICSFIQTNCQIMNPIEHML